jgi:riboflavin kinase/FMN adenylyltransferase
VGTRAYRGVTNIGCKPTVEHNGQIGVETHMFDFDEDIYGHEIRVELYTYERGEKEFSSVEELKHMVEKDIEFAKEYFKLKRLS